MKFELSKVYTAATAEMLEPGDLVIFAKNVTELKSMVADSVPRKGGWVGELQEIGEESSIDRFKIKDGAWYPFAYLVKKVEYRPFKNIKELVECWEKKNPGCVNRPECAMPQIWVRDKNRGDSIGSMLAEFFEGCVCIGTIGSCTLENLLQNYTFLDGTPCGVKK